MLLKGNLSRVSTKLVLTSSANLPPEGFLSHAQTFGAREA